MGDTGEELTAAWSVKLVLKRKRGTKEAFFW